MTTWPAMLDVALTVAATLGAPWTPPPDTVPLFDGLGSYHRPITVTDASAQAYFDQGLRLVYGFNHDEAIRSFREGARRDSACAMCWWGIALAYGPNINGAMAPEAGAEAWKAMQQAKELVAGEGTERERDFVMALARRYGEDPTRDRARLDSAYARAMKLVAERYPDDPDASVLYADALMNLSPWNYWTEDRKPRPGTPEILATLERVVNARPEHAGACHLFIHAVEAAEPERAVPCAEKLPDLMPGAGHIVHMPAHIFIRVGRWADAIDRNRHAVHADERYIHAERPRGVYPLAYYPHNYDFLTFAAMMAGMRDASLEAARSTAAATDREMMREPGLGALQHYVTTPLRVMVRFGMWDEILREPRPEGELPYMDAMWHFARGMAFASTGRADEAGKELEALRSIQSGPAAAEVTVWEFNTGTRILGIGAQILTGRIAEAGGARRDAIAAYREASRMEAGLTYNEPPDWPLPARQYLGSALLAEGRASDAETAFRQDLEQWPLNGWSLFGLMEALQAQGREGDAREVGDLLKEAWKASDVRLEAPVH